MINRFCLLIFTLIISGCITSKPTVESIQKQYQKVSMEDDVTDKEALVIAQNELLKSTLVSDYKLFEPHIDQDLMMPEAYKYIFVQFKPNENKPEISDRVFLVVINPYFKRVEYTGEFKGPGGDPVYKYHDLLKKIEHRE